MCASLDNLFLSVRQEPILALEGISLPATIIEYLLKWVLYWVLTLFGAYCLRLRTYIYHLI